MFLCFLLWGVRVDKMSPERECPAASQECPLLPEMEQLRERCRVLEELSYVDSLTGMYNFRYLQRALDMEIERTRRTRLPTSLIMADLDYFRNINTKFGHEAGNIVLAEVGRILRESIRLIDIPCRYGGEEFALILPSTSHVQAVKIAERLRASIASLPIDIGVQTVTVTGSFGVASIRHYDNITVNEFIRRADGFLYQAKEAGRNHVCAQEICLDSQETEVTQDEKEALFAPTTAGD